MKNNIENGIYIPDEKRELHPLDEWMKREDPTTAQTVVLVTDSGTLEIAKEDLPGNSGCLAQEVMCGYAARRGLLPTVQTQGLKQCENGKSVPMPLEMLPTPKANDFRSGMPNRVGTEHTQQLNNTAAYIAGQTSQLNPRFVAEMMGFPVDWTVLPFLNGETCPSKPTETPSCLK